MEGIIIKRIITFELNLSTKLPYL